MIETAAQRDATAATGRRRMDSLDRLAGLVGEFGRRCGIGDLSLDPQGVAALLIDGRFVVHVAAEPESDTLVLYALLGRVRDDERLVVWRRLLEYNPGAADGSSLGLDPATGEVMQVCRRSLAQLDHVAFERVLENFIATADLWVREIAAGAAPAPPSKDEHALGLLMQNLKA